MKKIEKVKLYQIPRGSKIKARLRMITFHHMDGMYSYCTVDGLEDPANVGANVIHLSASTPLKKVGDHYVIV